MQRDPTIVEDLENRIVRACCAINPQILRLHSAILDKTIFFERMEGGYFEHLLWNLKSGLEVHIIYNFYCFLYVKNSIEYRFL